MKHNFPHTSHLTHSARPLEISPDSQEERNAGREHSERLPAFTIPKQTYADSTSYELYQQRGWVEGFALDNWLQSEVSVRVGRDRVVQQGKKWLSYRPTLGTRTGKNYA
jgi:hypothetical protein